VSARFARGEAVRSVATAGLRALGARSRWEMTVDGMIHAFEMGSERDRVPIVFLHGLSGDTEGAAAMAATVAGRRRCLVPDAFDLAPRSRTDRQRSLGPRAQGSVLFRWLAAVGCDEVDIVGVSLGAWVGIWLATTQIRVRRMVLVSPAGSRVARARLRELALAVAPRGGDALIGRVFGPATAAAISRWSSPFLRTAAIRGLIAEIDDGDFIEHALPSVSARTFVLSGDCDEVVGSEPAQLIVDRVPTARGSWAAGQGHGLFYERAGLVYQTLRRELGLEASPHSVLGRTLAWATGSPALHPMHRRPT